MADIDEKGDKSLVGRPEGDSLQAADANDARVADASAVKAFRSLNKNAHNGSAGGDQDLSFELVSITNGQAKVVAARQPEHLESVSIEELILKGRRGDQFAVSIVQQMRSAGELPEEHRSKTQAKLQDLADEIYCRDAGGGSLGKQSKQPENIDTHTIKTLAQSNEVARSALEIRENIEKLLPAGSEREKLIAQLKLDVSPMLKAHVEQNSYTQADSNDWQVFTKLPKESQQKVIQALASCPELITTEYEKQLEAVAKALPKGLMNLSQHTMEALLDVGKAAGAICEFVHNVYFDQNRAIEKRDKAVETIRKGYEVCTNVFRLSDGYVKEVIKAGGSGDERKPFRDIAWLGQEIDSRWQSHSEAEKVEIGTEFAVGLALPQAIGVLAKSEKVTTALEELSRLVGPENRPKFGQAVGKLLDALAPHPTAVTTEGQRIPIPREAHDNRLLSKADDLADQQQNLPEGAKERSIVPEKLVPSERFVAELKQATERLSEGEQDFLRKHLIEIKPVRRITDKYPNINNQTTGCFDASEKTIFLAEEVFTRGEWIPNTDLQFMLKHEFGHAFNAKQNQFGNYVSNRRDFIKTFSEDFQKVPQDILDTLRLSTRFRNQELARDEVFADMYAHASALETSNPYSQLLKLHFPGCRKYLEDIPKL